MATTPHSLRSLSPCQDRVRKLLAPAHSPTDISATTAAAADPFSLRDTYSTMQARHRYTAQSQTPPVSTPPSHRPLRGFPWRCPPRRKAILSKKLHFGGRSQAVAESSLSFT